MLKRIRDELLGSVFYIIALMPFIFVFTWLDRFGVLWYHVLGGTSALCLIIILHQLFSIKKSVDRIETDIDKIETDYVQLEDELYKWRQKWE